MRDGQETPFWAKELDDARDGLLKALRLSIAKPDDALFDAIDRFVTAKIEAIKRERY